MFTRMKLIMAALGFSLIAGATCLAQQTQNQNQTPGAAGPQTFGRGHGRHGPEGPGGPGIFGPEIARQLNLTDDQKQQIRKIMEANFESTKTQREEMHQLMQKRFQGTLTAEDEARAKTLREQTEASRKDVESKVAAVLTPEQKTKLEELMKERKANHDRFGRHGGFRGQPGQRKPPATAPTNPPVQP